MDSTADMISRTHKVTVDIGNGPVTVYVIINRDNRITLLIPDQYTERYCRDGKSLTNIFNKSGFVFEQSKPEMVKAIAIALIRATELATDTQQIILGGVQHGKSGE